MNIIDETVRTCSPKEAERRLKDILGCRVKIGWVYDPDLGEWAEVMTEDENLIRRVKTGEANDSI